MNAMKIRTIVKLVVSVWTQWEATAVFVIKVTKLVTVEATVLVRALECSCTSVIRNYPFIHLSFPLFLLFSPSFHSHLFIHHLSDGPFIFSFHPFILSSLFFSLIQFSIHSFIHSIHHLSESFIDKLFSPRNYFTLYDYLLDCYSCYTVLYQSICYNVDSTDVRVGYCFEKFDEEGCTKPNGREMRKAMCCCTVGAGWGDPCELCPQKNTCEYTAIV